MPPPPLPHILRGLQRGARGAARGGRGCFPAAPHGAATPSLPLPSPTLPPAPPAVPPGPRPPPLPEDVLNRFQPSLGFVQPSPLRRSSLLGVRAEHRREWLCCRRGRIFSPAPIRAANSAGPFCEVGLAMWGGLGEVRRGALRTRLEGVEDVESRTLPGDCTRAGSGSVVNPGEERVASCRLHCPKIQMWGLGMLPVILCITQGGKTWDLYPKL